MGSEWAGDALFPSVVGLTNISSVVGRIQAEFELTEAEYPGRGIDKVLRLLLDRADEIRHAAERRNSVADEPWGQIRTVMDGGTINANVDLAGDLDGVKWEAAELRCLKFFVSQVCRMVADELGAAVAEEPKTRPAKCHGPHIHIKENYLCSGRHC
jgi:hypothetical protein